MSPPDVSQRWARREDLALLTDFYELTMAGGYWKSGRGHAEASFEYFFRELPPDSGFALFAGLEPLLDLIERLRFTEDDLSYLASLRIFDRRFLEFLWGFRPQGTIYAVPEGSLVFPHEPIIRVEAPLLEAQFLETAILNALNYPTLVATKAARVCLAAQGDPVIEFGLRRAQGPDGGLSGTRASYLGGAAGTSNVLAGKIFGIPVRGTQAHSWIMSFGDELAAFRAYAAAYPDNCLLLVDTYDTLGSGIPNAITVFKELRAAGLEVRAAVRLDSGDLARLSKAAYRMLVEAGFEEPLIMASNELNEDLIADLKRQKAPINAWGVGTHLITSSHLPALGGIYKLTAVRADEGSWEPRIKVSSNPAKMTDPGRKRVIRYRDADGHPLGDVLYLVDEDTPSLDGAVRFVGRQDLSFLLGLHGATSAEDLLSPVMRAGRRLRPAPALDELRRHAAEEVASLPEEYRRLRNPEIYTVGLSPTLAHMKADLIRSAPGVLAWSNHERDTSIARSPSARDRH